MRKIMSLTVDEDKTIKIAFEEFLRYKRINNIAPRTIKYYEDCFRYFTDFVGEDMLCESITGKTVLEYLENLRETRAGVSDVSVNTYLRGLRTFIYFCVGQSYTAPFKISLIKAEKPLKETYTDAELERLLEKPKVKKCSFSEYRNWVIVCYLLGTGNRRDTVCNIKVGDLNFETHEVQLIKVKNKKQYVIPLSVFLEKVLKEYILYRKGTAEDYLFCSVYGQKLTPDGLDTCIDKYNAGRGVMKKGIHLFRHTFAKKWIMNRGDPFRLKAILGHSTMTMVNEYVAIFGKDLQKDFEIFNPLDNMECIKRSTGYIKM